VEIPWEPVVWEGSGGAWKGDRKGLGAALLFEKESGTAFNIVVDDIYMQGAHLDIEVRRREGAETSKAS